MRLERCLAEMDRQLVQVGELATRRDAAALSISRWSVGDHLDHLLRTTSAVLKGIENPSPKSLQRKVHVTWIGRLVLLLGTIPRGRGRAPESVWPQDHTIDGLRSEVETLRAMISRLDARQLRASPVVIRHPVFGLLSAAHWISVLRIHQGHHLKIVRDILKSA